MTQENSEPSGASGGYQAVEFVGGPMDGLRLVEGIEDFGEPVEFGKRVCFSVEGSVVKYARRLPCEGVVLYLDVVEE